MSNPGSSRALRCLLFIPWFLLATVVSATDLLRGQAFSSPDRQLPRDEAWLQQPVVYDEKIGKVDLVVNLDQSTYPWLKPIIDDFAAEKGLKIEVLSGTCGVTNRMFLKKKIDIGSLCCPPGYEDRMHGVEFFTLGISPLAILAHPDNPLEDLSLAQVQELFMGEIPRWSEIPQAVTQGFDKPVQPHAFLHCKRRPGHWRGLLDNEELFSTELVSVLQIPEMIGGVAANPMAIGYDMLWLATEHYRDKGQVKIIKVDGVDPADLARLANGDYTLYRTLNLVLWAEGAHRKPLAEELRRHAMATVEQQGATFSIVSAQRLRAAGWRFKGDELIGEPEG
jgi:phosphate transport system substrate-binding protein